MRFGVFLFGFLEAVVPVPFFYFFEVFFLLISSSLEISVRLRDFFFGLWMAVVPLRAFF